MATSPERQAYRDNAAQREFIAKNILEQLGGGRFVMFTGAKERVITEKGLRMRLPSNLTKDRISHVEIRLEPNDTYTVEAQRQRGVSPMKVVATQSDVYAENLQDTFHSLTGLITRFGQ